MLPVFADKIWANIYETVGTIYNTLFRRNQVAVALDDMFVFADCHSGGKSGDARREWTEDDVHKLELMASFWDLHVAEACHVSRCWYDVG